MEVNRMKKLRTKMTLMLVLGLLVIGGASAAIVGYLSNTAIASIDVASPTTIGFAEVDHGEDVDSAIANVAAVTDWSDDLILSSTGLSTVELGLQIENNADVAIENKILSVEISNEGTSATCADLTSLTFIDVGCSPGTTYYQQIQELAGVGLCSNGEGEDVGIATFSIPINSLAAGNVYKYPVTITFGVVEPGEYTFAATMLN